MEDYTYWPKSLEGAMFKMFNDHIPPEATDRMTNWGRAWRQAICQAACRHADGEAMWTWVDFRAGSIAWGNAKTISFRKVGNVLDEQFPALNLNTIDKVVNHALSGPGGALIVTRPGSHILRMSCPIVKIYLYDFTASKDGNPLTDVELFQDHAYALSFVYGYHFNTPADEREEEETTDDENAVESADPAL